MNLLEAMQKAIETGDFKGLMNDDYCLMPIKKKIIIKCLSSLSDDKFLIGYTQNMLTKKILITSDMNSGEKTWNWDDAQKVYTNVYFTKQVAKEAIYNEEAGEIIIKLI